MPEYRQRFPHFARSSMVVLKNLDTASTAEIDPIFSGRVTIVLLSSWHMYLYSKCAMAQNYKRLPRPIPPASVPGHKYVQTRLSVMPSLGHKNRCATATDTTATTRPGGNEMHHNKGWPASTSPTRPCRPLRRGHTSQTR